MRRRDYGWGRYVPVSERRRKAERMMNQLRKRGTDIHPVRIEGRRIARTFWGEAWCAHLEKFSDYANRLPRGRTYVRNGSVCHLEIAEGVVTALVSGSHLYQVQVSVSGLPRKKWNAVKKRCGGQIGSLLELLKGRLSASVMKVVTDRDNGLFPLPREITLHCDCPDWATMCKHVAAVLYGVGARLDEEPELLFRLRGVDHEELIDAEAGVAAAAEGRGRRGRRLDEGELSEVFGIDIAEEPARPEPLQPPAAPTAGEVAQLRKKLGLTRSDFARLLGVSAGTISNWEKRRGRLRLHARTLAAWNAAAGLTKKAAKQRLHTS